MLSWIGLFLLLPAAMALVLFWSRCLALSNRDQFKDQLIASVWGPVLASLGFLGMLWDRSGVLGEGGAGAIGMGAVIFAIVAGMMLLNSASSNVQQDKELMTDLPLIWPVAGVVILLTAAAAKVPHLVGLIVCAIGLVLIWINTMPADSSVEQKSESDAQSSSLAGAFVSSLFLAVCAWWSTSLLPALALTVVSLVSLVLVMLVAAHRGVSQGIRMAGWLAVLLPCLGLGLLGHDQLFQMIQSGRDSAVPRLHETIGLLGPGLILLATTLVLAGGRRWSPTWRRYAGLGLFLVGVVAGGLAIRGLMA
ncbi:MAG: hypothetical protein CMJ39_10030 [Phycisphaerae bacterium]|nr:hypothetical protein [Phycisphaerae bacterium]